jgi:hypothetical protein
MKPVYQSACSDVNGTCGAGMATLDNLLTGLAMDAVPEWMNGPQTSMTFPPVHDVDAYKLFHYLKYDYVAPSADKCLKGYTAKCLPVWAKKMITLWDPYLFTAWLGDAFLTMPIHAFVPILEFDIVDGKVLEYFTETGAATKGFGDPFPPPWFGEATTNVYTIEGLPSNGTNGEVVITRTGECETMVFLSPSTGDWVGAHAMYVWLITKCGDKVEYVWQGKALGGQSGYTESITRYSENITLGTQYSADFNERLSAVLYNRRGMVDDGRVGTYPFLGGPGTPLWFDPIYFFCGYGNDRSVPCQKPSNMALYKETQAAVTAGYNDWYLFRDDFSDIWWFTVQLGANDWIIREYQTDGSWVEDWYIRNGTGTGIVSGRLPVFHDWNAAPPSGLPKNNYSLPENAAFKVWVDEYYALYPTVPGLFLPDGTPNPTPYYDLFGGVTMKSASVDPAVGITVEWEGVYFLNSTTDEKYWLPFTASSVPVTYPLESKTYVSEDFTFKVLSTFKGFKAGDYIKSP